MAGAPMPPARPARPPCRLVVVDDHPLILEGLDRLFRLEADFELVAKCVNADEALEALRAHRPDVLVLDLRLPGRRGLDVLEAIQREGLAVQTVLLTGAIQEDELMDALRLGARGVVLKEMAPELLVRCIRKVRAGELWLESELLGRAVQGMLDRDGVAGRGRRTLTSRELRIVRMAASGLHNREIAEELSITEGTVKVHLHNIYEKLSVTGRVELTNLARDQGWV